MTDPSLLPHVSFPNGDRMPAIGLGTFGSDNYSAKEIATAVIGAGEVGYRHFDCASVYGNEAEIGSAFDSVCGSGIAREELWITSKVWNDKHSAVAESCERTLRDLHLDYLDLYLVHWPFPNHHRPGVGVDSRDPHAVPFDHDRYMRTWSQMEDLVDRGLVRHPGTSNMTVSKLAGVLKSARIMPAANELEMHPHFQQPKLFDFLKSNGIVSIGYSPIGSPSRPERDRTPEDSVDVEDPVIVKIAHRLGIRPAVVCVLWQIQRGSVPIPFSVKRSQYETMLDAVTSSRITDEEMAEIAHLDRRCRLIKGQVFLWESAKDWTDLWDGEA